MGHLFSDGKAVDVTAPAGTFHFGDLYRISGFTGIALDEIASGDTVRDMALEMSERVWKVKVPSGFSGAAGTYVYWSSGAGTKVGETDLASSAGTAGDRPIGVVVVAKNSNGYAAIKLFQAGPALA